MKSSRPFLGVLLACLLPALASAQVSNKQIGQYNQAPAVSPNDKLLLQQGPVNTQYTNATLGQLLAAIQAQQITSALGYTPVNPGTDTRFSSSGYFGLPRGTTAQRPANPQPGDERYNTTIQAPEFWNGTAWQTLATQAGGGGTQPLVAPSAPTAILIGTATTSSLPVSWTASATGTTPSYQALYRVSGTGAVFQGFGTPTAGITSVTITGLASGTSYDVEVVASNAAGTATSAVTTGSTLAIAPAAPTGLSAPTVTDTTIALAWAASGSGSLPINYQAQEKINGVWTNIGPAGTNTTYTATGLTASTSYSFLVLASNVAGIAPSAPLSVTTAAAATVAPGAVGNLSVTAATQTSLTSTWTAPTTGTGTPTYKVEHVLSGGSTFTTDAASQTSTTAIINGLTAGTVYEIRVTPANSAGTGPAAIVYGQTASGCTTPTSSVTGSQTVGTSPQAVISAPTAISVPAGGSVQITGVSISDPPYASNGGSATMNLSSGGGTLGMTQGGQSLSGSGTASWQYNGTLSQQNTALGTLTYTAGSTTGSYSMTLDYFDQGGNETTVTIAITVVSSSCTTSGSGAGGQVPPPSSGGTIPTDATGVQAAPAQAVLNTFGIDTHIDGCCTNTYDANLTQFEANLNYLAGVKHLRDSPGNDNALTWWPQVAQATGVDFDAFIGEDAATNFNNDLSRIRSIRQNAQTGHIVFAYEGANEPDSGQANGFAETLQDGANFQPTVYQAAQADGVKTFEMSFGQGWTQAHGNYGAVGVVGNTDYTSGHTYPQGAPNMGGWPGYLSDMDTIDQDSKIPAPGVPVAITEFGYLGFPVGQTSASYGAVDYNVQGIYLLEAISDSYNYGNKYLFWYAFYPDISGDFGLFDGNYQPRPAANDIRNFFTLLGDTGANAASFGTGKLNVTFSGAPTGANVASGHQKLVMQKSDGTFWVDVYNEQELNNSGASNATISVATVPVTMNLGSTMTSVTEYDPTQGTTAIQTWNNVSSITYQEPAHPLIFKIVHP